MRNKADIGEHVEDFNTTKIQFHALMSPARLHHVFHHSNTEQCSSVRCVC